MFVRLNSYCFGCSSLESGCRQTAYLGMAVAAAGAGLVVYMGYTLWLVAAFACCGLISYSLLHGVTRRDPRFVLVHVAFDAAGLCAHVILLFANAVFIICLTVNRDAVLDRICDTMGMRADREVTDVVLYLCVGFAGVQVVLLVFCVYSFLVVYSFYKELQEELACNGLAPKVEEANCEKRPLQDFEVHQGDYYKPVNNYSHTSNYNSSLGRQEVTYNDFDAHRQIPQTFNHQLRGYNEYLNYQHV